LDCREIMHTDWERSNTMAMSLGNSLFINYLQRRIRHVQIQSRKFFHTSYLFSCFLCSAREKKLMITRWRTCVRDHWIATPHKVWFSSLHNQTFSITNIPPKCTCSQHDD
jgi:hypothetical protein